MIIIDSNYLFAIANKFDALHKKAKAINVAGMSVLYLEDVLKEVQTIVSVRQRQADSFAWIDSIYENEIADDRQYNLSSAEYFEVLNEWRSHKDSRMSFVDAEIIHLAKKYQFQVLTFDEEIKKRLPKHLVFA